MRVPLWTIPSLLVFSLNQPIYGPVSLFIPLNYYMPWYPIDAVTVSLWDSWYLTDCRSWNLALVNYFVELFLFSWTRFDIIISFCSSTYLSFPRSPFSTVKSTSNANRMWVSALLAIMAGLAPLLNR